MSAADPEARSRRAGPGWWAAVAAIAAAGAWLRLRGLADLQLILDERLVLRGLRQGSLLDALVSHACSPLRLYRQLPDSFRSHPDALARLVPIEAPAFYREIAADPEAGDALLECPDPGNLIHSAPYAGYQQTHRKRVLLLSPSPGDVQRGFRNQLEPDDVEAQRRSGARYAVIHLDLNAEIFGEDAAPLARFDVQVKACREALRAHWGAPVHRDDRLEVYELREAGAAPGGGR